ncbi:leukemia NUP98 fusion partner 1 [Aplochiton taeniatus]
MSSYWGHESEKKKDSRESFRKRSFRKPVKSPSDRRASLPCSSQLDAMQLNHLGVASTTNTPVHFKTSEEKEVRSHPRARRSSSEDTNRNQSAIPEDTSITTIPELTESFERRLSLRSRKGTTVGDADHDAVICHEHIRNAAGGVQEQHYTHRCHKEAARRLEQGRPRSDSSAAACERRRPSDERRRSGDGQIYEEQEEYHRMPHRQLSLRRQR